MKKQIQLFLAGILMLGSSSVNAQVFTENFDSATVNMISSGVPGFIVTNAYSQSSPNSGQGTFNVSGASTFTSPDFSTTGNQFVTLQFSHICKVSFFDSCVVELSTNSGTTWTQLNSATCTYLGSSVNFATTKWFGAFSYTVWDISNPGSMSNTWWKQELFDISSLCANQPTVRFRFRMRDNNNNGMESFYGWVIDNIEVNVSACELQPPVIKPGSPNLSGTVYTLGPYNVSDTITDASALTADLYWNINNTGWQFVNMAPSVNNVYTGQIPQVNNGDSVCWYLIATDFCGNVAQYPPSSLCFIALDQISIPFCDNFDGVSSLWTSTSVGGSQWQLGTPGFGLTNTPHSFPNAWDINLFSGYTNNAVCDLVSPTFDFSNILYYPIIVFWLNYNVSLNDGVQFQYNTSVNPGTWLTLGTVGSTPPSYLLNWYNGTAGGSPGWTGVSNGWTPSSIKLSLANTPGLAGDPDVHFRFHFTADGANTLDGFSIDDFCLQIPIAHDVGISAIVQPLGAQPVGTTVPIVVTLENYGTNTQTSVPISYQIQPSGQTGTFTWNGSLPGGQSVDITLPDSLLIISGNQDLCVFTSLPDTVYSNDTTCSPIFGVPTISLTSGYCDDFESATTTWNNSVDPLSAPGTNWQLGMPAFGQTSSAHSGIKAWDINLTSAYQQNALVYLESPFFDFSATAGATLSFWQNRNILTFNNDGAWLEYSIDGGVNWDTLGSRNDPCATNWYNNTLTFPDRDIWDNQSGGWIKSSYLLSCDDSIDNAVSPVQFRFVFESQFGSSDGISIDDFSIFLPPPDDVGIVSITQPGSVGIQGDTVAVIVSLQNFGINIQTMVQINGTFNGVPLSTSTWTGSISTSQVISDTLQDNVILMPGNNVLCVWTSLPGDSVQSNDSTCINITGTPVVAVPYCDNFDGGISFWHNEVPTDPLCIFGNPLPNAGSNWELGTPTWGVQIVPFSPPNIWDLNLNNSYTNLALAYLMSPIFDFTNTDSATLSFMQNWNTEQAWDGTRLEYSNDGGNSWIILGSTLPPAGTINWYTNTINSSCGQPAWAGNSTLHPGNVNGWVQCKYELINEPAFNNPSPGQSLIQFRFVFTSDNSVIGYQGTSSDAGVAIDNLCLRVPIAIDGGVEAIVSPSGSSQANTNIPVTLLLKNFGSQTLTSMNVGVRVNNNTAQTQTWTGSLIQNQTTGFTPSFTVNLPGGNNTICAWAVPTGDGDATNDTACTQVFAIPAVNLPYSNNFENNSNDWYAPFQPGSFTNWELGTPVFGSTTGAYSGDTCWDINLNSAYNINANTYIQSPYFNITGLNALRLSFWQNQHIEVDDGYHIEYDFDNAGSWTVLGSVGDPNGINWYNTIVNGVGAWSLGSSGWLKSEYTMFAIGIHTNIAFRMAFSSDVNGAGLNYGVSIDDIFLNTILPLDAGIKTIYAPSALPAGSIAPVWQVSLRNYGSQSISNIPVTVALNGSAINTFIYPGALLPGDSTLIAVSGYTVPTGAYSLCAFTSLTGDGDYVNDTLCRQITGVPFITPIYTDNFDNGNIGWTVVAAGDPSTNWELGIPGFGATNYSNSPPNCWDINLNTPYGDNAISYLYSPFFDFSNAFSPYVSFWQNYNTEAGFDGVRLEYSFNGAPWSVLGYLGDPSAVNWYTSSSISSSGLPAWVGNSGGFMESKYDLSFFPPTSMLQFRFVFTSDGIVVADGHSIDDFTLFSAFAQDVGAKAVLTPGPNVGAPFYTPVVVRIKNFGYNPSANFNVSYIANGGLPVSVAYTATLQPGDSADVTLTGFTTQPGVNFIKAYTGMGGDLYHPNDTVNYSFFAVFTTTPPYVDNFDSGNIGWSVVPSVTGTTWELGMPNFGTTNSVHTGIACWDVNLDAPYHNAALTRLISPVFNYINSISSTLQFWTNYNMEYGQDGMRVEYSTDGINFNPLGTYNDPNGTNWYDHASVAAFGGDAAFSGSSLGWKQAIYNTTAFNGFSYVQYAFVFRSDVNLSGDGISVDDFELTNVVGMDELNDFSQVILQPNPVANNLMINLNADQTDKFCYDGKIMLSIIDATGRQMLNKAFACESTLIKMPVNVTSLEAGVYIIRLQSNNGSIVRRFVKE